MLKYSLNGIWNLRGNSYECTGNVPGSVYSILLENNLIDDPYYADNELRANELSKHNYAFSREFDIDFNPVLFRKIELVFEGLDTICNVFLNDSKILYAENMFVCYRVDVKALLKRHNTIRIEFTSPIEYIKEKNDKTPLYSVRHCTQGFPHIRKAHCMFGWDWGARMPDMGIYRDVYIEAFEDGNITDCYFEQKHENGQVFLKPNVEFDGGGEVEVALYDDGKLIELLENGRFSEIKNPKLWWPNGYGKPNLYKAVVKLSSDGKIRDEKEFNIGLRKVELIREKDENGESFKHRLNGIDIMALGANMIPEDYILSRVTYQRTEKLLLDCVNANYNIIRVWGGGYYPNNYFFDLCDKLGLMVWQDFVFSLGNFLLYDEFKTNLENEFNDVIKRIRNHACLILWCGNNEMSLFESWGPKADSPYKQAHKKIFFEMLPEIVNKLNSQTPYWPTSPWSGTSNENPNLFNMGDTHYWGELYEFNDKFRYLSEFGSCSLPSYQSICKFVPKKDCFYCSETLERHAKVKNLMNNIMARILKYYQFSESLSDMAYLSQLSAAYEMHQIIGKQRISSDYCSGILYWQLNDMWPVISWSAVDYYGEKKSLWYTVKRDYAQLFVFADINQRDIYLNTEFESEFPTISLYVCNNTCNNMIGILKYGFYENNGNAIYFNENKINMDAHSTVCFNVDNTGNIDRYNNYLHYSLICDEKVVFENCELLVQPKYYKYSIPKIQTEVEGNILKIFSDSFADSVEIYSEDEYLELSENYFTMAPGKKEIKIIAGNASNCMVRTLNYLNLKGKR